MDLENFEKEVREALQQLDYVQDFQMEPRTPISVKGTAKIEHNYVLSIFYNASFFVLSFSLIFEKKRIWGLDRDNRIGWHIHPLDAPDTHQPTDEKSIAEVIALLDETMQQLYAES